ncbi:MAG TPA: FliH/SctL family protein, partial [Azospirillaceae bacterium]|nr:FliH/SctL family protein [Azospirillaceae bacterium]
AEAEAAIANAQAQALQRVAEGVGQLIAAREQTNTQRQNQPLRITLAMTRKLFPDLARRHGLDEIEAMVRSILIELIDEPRLVVRMPPDMQAALAERIDGIAKATAFAGRLAVLPDDQLAPGDCRVEWADGGAERSTQRLIADVEQIAARMIGQA